MSREDYAWAAGLFEGEGCFSPRRPRDKKSMHLYASLTSTDEDVVHRFAAIIGIGFVTEVRPRLPHHKPAWRWGANGESVERVYELLDPWLGIRRKARYAELLSERHTYEAERRDENRRRGTQAAQRNRSAVTGRFVTQGRLS